MQEARGGHICTVKTIIRCLMALVTGPHLPQECYMCEWSSWHNGPHHNGSATAAKRELQSHVGTCYLTKE